MVPIYTYSSPYPFSALAKKGSSNLIIKHFPLFTRVERGIKRG
jgi:hypothetical protein